MRKLSFRHILPLSQVLIASVLLKWDDIALGPQGLNPLYACYGINAPAITIWQLARILQIDYAFASLAPFNLGHLLFLAGVAVVWYWVGRAIDLRQLGKAPELNAAARRHLIWNICLVLLGIYLMIGGLELAHTGRRNNGRIGDLVAPALFEVWSGFLIVLPGRRLVRAIRGRRPGGPASLMP